MENLRTTWNLVQASKELKISQHIIKKTVQSWPMRVGVGNKDKIILSERHMELLHIFVKTQMYFTYKGLIEIRDEKLNIRYNGSEF